MILTEITDRPKCLKCGTQLYIIETGYMSIKEENVSWEETSSYLCLPMGHDVWLCPKCYSQYLMDYKV